MLDEFPTEEENAIYREKFPEIFNLATLPFYWSSLEPEMGKPRYSVDSPRIYRRPTPDLCIQYCKEKGIEPKCHCLNYDTESPRWYRNQPVSFCKEKLLERFQQIADRYSKDIYLHLLKFVKDILECCHSWIQFCSLAIAVTLIQVDSAHFANSFAIIAAQNLHRPVYQNLFVD